MPAPRLRTCIACGKKTVARLAITVSRLDGRQVAGVEADVCRNCGEQYYDADAMRRIQSAGGKSNSRRQRAA